MWSIGMVVSKLEEFDMKILFVGRTGEIMADFIV